MRVLLTVIALIALTSSSFAAELQGCDPNIDYSKSTEQCDRNKPPISSKMTPDSPQYKGGANIDRIENCDLPRLGPNQHCKTPFPNPPSVIVEHAKLGPSFGFAPTSFASVTRACEEMADGIEFKLTIQRTTKGFTVECDR